MKILIITNNCFSITNNMGKTLDSLFYDFEEKDLCQFYIQPVYPDSKKVLDLYRVTDKEVLKKFFIRNSKIGKIIDKNIVLNNHDQNYGKITEHIYRKFRLKKPIVKLFRHIFWSNANVFSTKLNEWIVKQQPDLIFFASGNFAYLYKLTLDISSKFHIPIVSYFCDDYYTFNLKNLLPIEFINWVILKKNIKKILNKSILSVYICDSFNNYYKRIFNLKNTLSIMTPSEQLFNHNEVIKNSFVNENKIVISYFGNIRLNRWKTILEFSEYIENNNINAEIHLFAPPQSKKISHKIKKHKNIIFNGFVNSETMKHEIFKSDYLLNVESFKSTDIKKVKYSFSTKIPQYLSSKKPIINFAPKEIAVTEYLNLNEAAFNFTSSEELKELNKIFDIKLKDKIVSNAFKLYNKNHKLDKNSKLLRENIDKYFPKKKVGE